MRGDPRPDPRPVVLVLAETVNHHRLVEFPSLEGGQLVRRHTPGVSENPRPAVVVLVIPSCGSDFAVTALCEIRRLGHEASAIILTSQACANAYLLGTMRRGRKAWLGEPVRRLVQMVEDLLGRDLRCRARDLFLAALPPGDRILRRGAAAAFLGDPPPRNHQELAAAAGVSEGTFRGHRRDAGLPSRSEALVDWGLLATVTQARARGMSLERACLKIGVAPRRVQRAAERRARKAAGHLDQETLLEALTSWVAGPYVPSDMSKWRF